MSDLKKDFEVTVHITIEAFDAKDADDFVEELLDEMGRTEDGDQYQKFIEAYIDSTERVN